MIELGVVREFNRELVLEISWAEFSPRDPLDTLMEVPVEEDEVVDAHPFIQLVKKLDGKLVHVVAGLHEENAVQEVKVLLELAVRLNLVQEYGARDALTFQELADHSRIHEVMDRVDPVELD